MHNQAELKEKSYLNYNVTYGVRNIVTDVNKVH